jgi:hypothetical protein
MPINDYYGTAYDQGYDPYYRPVVPQGSISNWVGHLTADDNGAAQVIDPGKLYQMLTGPMQEQKRRRADLDKQLRLSYMDYDPEKIPSDYNSDYQNAYNQYSNFFKENSRALSNGNVDAASQLQQLKNNVRDVAAQAILQGQKKKQYTSFITAHAHQKNPEWAEKAMAALKGAGLNDDIDAKMAPLIQSDNQYDINKIDNSLKYIPASYQLAGTDKYGNKQYAPVAPTMQHMQMVNKLLDTPQGHALVEHLAQTNGISYDEAHKLYATQKTQELDARSIGRMGYNHYDNQDMNNMIKSGNYQMAQAMFPERMALMQSQIERNQQAKQLGNTQLNEQQFLNDLSGKFQNDPQAFLKDMNSYAANKSIFNKNAFTYDPKTNTYSATLLDKSGKNPVQFAAPNTPEGTETMIDFIKKNGLENPSTATVLNRIRNHTPTHTAPTQQQHSAPSHSAAQGQTVNVAVNGLIVKIPAANLQKLMQKYPNAKVVQ